jgi:acetate kinase
MASSLGGLDALVFTGGVGERSAAVRAGAVERLGFLGVAIDPSRNDSAQSETEVSAEAATVATLVIPAREDREIARQVRWALA